MERPDKDTESKPIRAIHDLDFNFQEISILLVTGLCVAVGVSLSVIGLITVIKWVFK